MDLEIEKKYAKIVRYFAKDHGEALDLQSIVFLIGVRELGEGIKTFSKREKNDLMHIAVCKLLIPYGYYTLDFNDQDGWPHYIRNESLPLLNKEEQKVLLKESVVQYFDDEALLEA